MAVDIKDLTSNVIVDPEYNVSGDGVFDDLMETITKHITAQYDAGKITGPEYATVYLGALQSVLAESVKYLMEDANKELIEAQKDELILNGAEDRLLKETQRTELEANGVKDREHKDAQIALSSKQKDLYARQIQGFDENKNQKLFEAQLNSWGLMFSSGMMEEVPSIITNDALSKLYCEIQNGTWTPPDLSTDPVTPGSCSYSAS